MYWNFSERILKVKYAKHKDIIVMMISFVGVVPVRSESRCESGLWQVGPEVVCGRVSPEGVGAACWGAGGAPSVLAGEVADPCVRSAVESPTETSNCFPLAGR